MQGQVEGGVHSKRSTVVEEADESAFWMEVLIEAEAVKEQELTYLLDEAKPILKIVFASRKTVSEKSKWKIRN